MKRIVSVAAAAAFLLAIAVPVFAQDRTTSHDEHHPGTPTASAASPAPTAPGATAGAMPAMDMCRQMMGDSMGMPGMGGGAADTKHHTDMLEMRGEMMKAMGDIMMKHAHRMRGTEAR